MYNRQRPRGGGTRSPCEPQLRFRNGEPTDRGGRSDALGVRLRARPLERTAVDGTRVVDLHRVLRAGVRRARDGQYPHARGAARAVVRVVRGEEHRRCARDAERRGGREGVVVERLRAPAERAPCGGSGSSGHRGSRRRGERWELGQGRRRRWERGHGRHSAAEAATRAGDRRTG